MKRIIVATEYICAATRGDVPMESGASSGEEDSESDEDEDGSNYD